MKQKQIKTKGHQSHKTESSTVTNSAEAGR